MKLFYLTFLFVSFSLLCEAQSSLDDATITINESLFCSTTTGHKDGINFTKEVEKSYN